MQLKNLRIKKYGKNVLKEKEKEELLRKYKAGDMSARDALVNGNLRLVLSVVQRFSGRGENMDDLFQIGCIGLMKAIDNFDITLNVKFSYTKSNSIMP